MSRVEILRGLVLEKMAVAVQEILAVVEMTVAGYEKDLFLLKRELGQHKRQLHAILQPQVILNRIGDELKNVHKDTEIEDCGTSETCGEENGVDGVLQKVLYEETLLEHEKGHCILATLPNDESVSCPAHREESQGDDITNNVQITKVKRSKRLPEQYRSNHVTKSDNIEKNKDNEWKPNKNKKSSNVKKKCLIKLRIGLLKNCPETDPSNTAVTLESPVHTIMCQQHLSEYDFINQLRSTFPELGENKPFEAYLADSTERPVPYLANRMTSCELHKTFRSCEHKHFDFYIHLKEHEDTLINTATTSLDDQTTKSDLEGEIPSEKGVINKQTDEQDMFCMDSAAQREDDEDDDWKPEDNREDEEQNNEEENRAALKPEKKIRKQREQKFYSGLCKVCGYLFRSQTLLIKHAQSHLDHQYCRCGVCGQQLESSGELKTHLETHQKLHQCGTCGHYFVSLFSFQRHVATHKLEKPKQLQLHCNNDNPYKCKICPQSFKFKVHLQDHTRKHTGEKPYCCDICGKSLTSYRNLCQHKLIHSAEKNYSCQQCGNLFHSVTSLKRHEVIHTVREKKYLCDICSKSFYTKIELTMHQRIHAQLHFIKCTVCNKLLKGDLKKHMRIHTREKTFTCKECGKKFRCPHHLKRHANKHLELKPFTCTVCGYTCERRDNLVSHMRTHTGEKPYKCTMCDKAFTQSHCLKTHVKKSHVDVDVESLV